jgi:predicted Rossmann fold nucleotide-binding protein DprA/Smf involved in DNA uptake
MNIAQIHRDERDYPKSLASFLGIHAPRTIWALGNREILNNKKIGIFCSSKCSGDVIIKTYDLAKKWRDDGVTVIGGFHSPMEQECLSILLSGKQSVIVCPARGIENMRLKSDYKTPLAESRLLFLSPFPGKEKRMTADLAVARNRFVAALADEIFVAHAAEGGKIEAFCCELAARGKSLTTLESDANTNLIALGARPVSFKA